MVRNISSHTKKTEDNSSKGRGRRYPSASPPLSRRCSSRLLKAKCPEPISKDIVNPLLRDLSTTKRVARNAKIVTQVPISPGDVLKSCTRARKLISSHSKTGPPSKAIRGKSIRRENSKDTLEEKSVDNLQQSPSQRGRFVQKTNNNDIPEEEHEHIFQPFESNNLTQVDDNHSAALFPPNEVSLNNHTRMEITEIAALAGKHHHEDEEEIISCYNPTQIYDNHCAAPFPPNEVSLNNHTGSASDMAITEIAALAVKYPHEDEDEINSCYNPSLVTVGGYRVKEEFATLSRTIIKKYGDILENCSLETPRARSAFLEMICQIIQRLQGSTFEIITSGELKNMLKEIAEMDTIDIRVGWLQQKLVDIIEAKRVFSGSCLLKEKKDIIRKDVNIVERNSVHAQKMLQVWQNEVVLLGEKSALLKLESEEIQKAEISTRAKATRFLQNHNSLVDGLL